MKIGSTIKVLCLTLLSIAVGANGRSFNSDVSQAAIQKVFLPLFSGPSLEKQPDTYDVYSGYESFPQISSDGSLCSSAGVFAKEGSCQVYYQCVETPDEKVFSRHVFFCLSGQVFDGNSKSCIDSDQRPECVGVPDDEESLTFSMDITDLDTIRVVQDQIQPTQRSHNRRKRFAFLPAITGILSHPLTQAAIGILGGSAEEQSSEDYSQTLRNLEYQLEGISGKIHNVELSIIENQIESNMQSTILKSLITKGNENNKVSFTVTQNLIKSGILENHIRAAEIKGLISKQRIENENHFERVQVSLGELENFIRGEIVEMKINIKKGFESVSQMIDQSKVEPLLSRLLSTIKNFNQRGNHIQNLPEESRIEEIKRRGGYLDYLETNTITDILSDIIQQNMAIPANDADMTAVFTLDLLVQGLQVHVNMKSSVILSNAFLAAKALEKINIENFNTYMLRLSASVSGLKADLGNSKGQGLIGEVTAVIEKVQKLSYSADIFGLTELIAEKRAVIENLHLDIENLVKANTELDQPGTIRGKPYFGTPSISTPIASWKKGKGVSYAIQHISNKGISRLGAWSSLYTVTDKANPSINLPVASQGITRVVYRRFDQEDPERVAVIEDHTHATFRDINYDLLTAAAQPNEQQAVEEVNTLIKGGADANAFIGIKMTPLHYAARQGNTAVIDILMANGADIQARTIDNEEPLHFAALFGETEGVNQLVGKGARINAQTRSLGLSPLHIAVANNHIGVTRALIQKGAFVNIKDNNGFTPLHISISGKGDTTDVLLQCDTVDVNAIDNFGLTPLHYAARSSEVGFIMKLLNHKDIDPNPQTKSLLSPMHFAAMTDDLEAIQELYEHGVPVTVQDKLGFTPLHYASFYNSQNAALLLTEIDPSLKNIGNNDGKLPSDVAIENNSTLVTKILSSNLDELDVNGYIELLGDETNETHTLPVSECTNNIASNMALTAEETCAHVGNVEAYVNLVMSMVPLSIYYKDREDMTQIFTNYDHDLGVAQNHARIWRNGDSIVGGIRETFDLVRLFEPEFTRKYKINQERVEVIKQNVDQVKMVNETKDEINKLETQLNRTVEAMSQAKSEFLLDYFTITITDINNTLEEKKRELKEDFTIVHELEEVVDFLNFVRKDSDRIRSVASKTRQKIETFRDHLEHDKGAFERHRRVAKETFEKLQNETIKNNEALAENKKKQEEIERKMEAERKHIKELYEDIHKRNTEKFRLIQQTVAAIAKSLSKSKPWKIAAGIIAGPIGYKIADRIFDKQVDGLRDNMNSGILTAEQSITAIKHQIDNNRHQLKFLQEQMANSTSNSDELRNELNDFITLDGDLNVMADKVETLLEAINKALVGVKFIKVVFDDVTKKLTDMIDLATNAKTEAERLNAKFFIYNELSLLECNWRNVYFNMKTLDTCTKPYEILYT